ncbi:MAG: hypothetical protein HC917_24060 [Richelia sp. SM2_1_7]|nr:hypothetical protein [Richelia sp. SM2_1_7]
MIPIERQTPLFILSGLTAAIASVISFVGILNNQIYLPFTPEELLPGVISQDIISLVASLGLLVCLVAIRRGAHRAWTVWLGLTGYFFMHMPSTHLTQFIIASFFAISLLSD